MLRRTVALPLICIAVVAATAATGRPAGRSLITATTGPTAPLATGLGDPAFQGPQQSTAFAMASQAGATYARLFVPWASIAPAALPPSGFVQTDPNSPYYRWDALDASVAAADAHGITPILDIVWPPGWAFKVRPGKGTGGSPKIAALRAFATALARHYDTGPAPTAHVFSVWNEPNYDKNLYPQDPAIYRSMVNAVADAAHGVNPSNLVLAGELAPGRHAPGKTDRNRAIAPLAFMRSMLCLSDTLHVRLVCHKRAKFDVWAHHPYSDTGPFGRARDHDGVELGDLPRMNALLQAAAKLGAIRSAKPVQFWVTEVGWSSNPPNKRGAPLALETRWVAETMYQMWRSNVAVGMWFLLQDRPLTTPFQSGLYFRSTSLASAQPKPLLASFRFPFVAYLKAHGTVQIWGRVTTGDAQTVTIDDAPLQPNGTYGPWKSVAAVTANRYGIFRANLPLGITAWYLLRASAPGSGTSNAFSLQWPRNESMTVTPFPPN